MSSKNLYSVAVTAIIEKNGRYLITKRSENKKRFPGRWTVPGGRLEPSDYQDIPKDEEHEWYNILERVVRREVKEEVGIEINDIDYVTSILADLRDGVAPTLIVSLSARPNSGEIEINPDEISEAVWVTIEEAKNYDLIADIYGELLMAEERSRGVRREWRP